MGQGTRSVLRSTAVWAIAEQRGQPHVSLLSCCSGDSAAFSDVSFFLTSKMCHMSSPSSTQICSSRLRPAGLPARCSMVQQLVVVRSIFWER